jgi:hypothetical protein
MLKASDGRGLLVVSYLRKPLTTRKAASSTRFATSKMTAEASVWIIVLFINDCQVACPGIALE